MTEKKLPVQKVLVGPYEYSITYDPNIRQAGDVVGLFGADMESILIDPQLGRMKERETVLHEVRHGIWHMCLSDELSDKQEEKVIKRETPLLLDVLRRNPRLVKYLLGG